MERHAQAKAARLEFAAFLNELKEKGGIERQKVAELMGVPAPTLSRMAAEEVKDRPTFAPPPDWRATLAVKLRALGQAVVAIADGMGPGEPAPPVAQPRAGIPYPKEFQARRAKRGKKGGDG